MPFRSLPRTLCLLAAGMAMLAFPVRPTVAADKTLVDKGEMVVRKNCARCHAVGREGGSPHKDAPPFRTLSAQYPVSDLAESLIEGIFTGHPDMPIFVFGPDDVEAIINYLESIQE